MENKQQRMLCSKNSKAVEQLKQVYQYPKIRQRPNNVT